jgi:hypothetical protein
VFRRVREARRFVSQSIVLGYGYRDHGDRVPVEEDRSGEPQGDRSDPHLAAMRINEELTFSAPEGIALRYGLFHGGDLAACAPPRRPQTAGRLRGRDRLGAPPGRRGPRACARPDDARPRGPSAAVRSCGQYS